MTSSAINSPIKSKVLGEDKESKIFAIKLNEIEENLAGFSSTFKVIFSLFSI